MKNTREKIELAYKLLDNLSEHECMASVYTLTDDEFGSICFAKDLLFEVVEVLNQPKMRSYEEQVAELSKTITKTMEKMGEVKFVVKK